MKLSSTICSVILSLSAEVRCRALPFDPQERSDAGCNDSLLPVLGVNKSSSSPLVPATSVRKRATHGLPAWDENSVGTGPSMISNGAPRSSDTQWQDSMNRGRFVWQQLQDTLNDESAADDHVCGIGDRWGIATNSVASGHLDPDPWAADTILPGDLDDLLETATFFHADIVHPKPPSTNIDFSFDGSYAPHEGIIDVGEAEPWNEDPDLDEHNPPPSPPDSWSDVTWWAWESICASQQADPNGLKWILDSIDATADTKDIQDIIIERDYGEIAYHDDDANSDEMPARRDVFYAGQDNFLAMLGSKQVWQRADFIIRHNLGIGRKTIISIGSYRSAAGHDTHFWIELGHPGDHPMDPRPGSSVASNAGSRPMSGASSVAPRPGTLTSNVE